METNEINCPVCRKPMVIADRWQCKCGMIYHRGDFVGAEYLPDGIELTRINEPLEPSAAKAPVRTAKDRPKQVIGNVLGAVLFLAPVVFLIGKCAGDSSPPPTAAELEQRARGEAEQRALGSHCLSAWDGAQPQLVALVKNRLRDPASFEHIETRTSPADAAGKNVVMMKFRSRNGFGGMNVGMAKGSMNNATCAVILEQVEN